MAQKPRQLTVPLGFLGPGAYSVKLYKDSTEGDVTVVEDMAIDTTEGLKIPLPTGGGFAVKVSR